MTTTTLQAPDIECAACAAAIRRVLTRTPGIDEVRVDVAAKTVTVSHNLTVEAVRDALSRAGFPPI